MPNNYQSKLFPKVNLPSQAAIFIFIFLNFSFSIIAFDEKKCILCSQHILFPSPKIRSWLSLFSFIMPLSLNTKKATSFYSPKRKNKRRVPKAKIIAIKKVKRIASKVPFLPISLFRATIVAKQGI